MQTKATKSLHKPVKLIFYQAIKFNVCCPGAGGKSTSLRSMPQSLGNDCIRFTTGAVFPLDRQLQQISSRWPKSYQIRPPPPNFLLSVSRPRWHSEKHHPPFGKSLPKAAVNEHYELWGKPVTIMLLATGRNNGLRKR